MIQFKTIEVVKSSLNSNLLKRLFIEPKCSIKVHLNPEFIQENFIRL